MTRRSAYYFHSLDSRLQLQGSTGEERYVDVVQLLSVFTGQGRSVYIQKRENPIVKRLNKTKVEREVDHEEERQERIKKENAVKKAEAVAQVRR